MRTIRERPSKDDDGNAIVVHETVWSIHVVHVFDLIDAGNARDVRAETDKVNNGNPIVLDLSKCNTIDTAGMRILLQIVETCRNRIRIVVLPGSPLAATLKGNELTDVLPLSASLRSALRSLTQIDKSARIAAAVAPLVVCLEPVDWDLTQCSHLLAQLAPAFESSVAIIDMSRVAYMDSSCLSMLVRMQNERMSRKLEPAAFVLSPVTERLFQILSYDKIWPVFRTLDDALVISAQSLAS